MTKIWGKRKKKPVFLPYNKENRRENYLINLLMALFKSFRT